MLIFRLENMYGKGWKEKVNSVRNRPLISVVVPVYNTEQYFERCIESILDQSYKNLEVIVVNDGSPGNISELIQKYKKDSRVNFIDNKDNRGLLRARVCGAQKATGEYLAFVDSDDYLSFDFYRSLVTRAEETDADIVIGKTVWDNNGDKYIYNYHDSCFNFDILEGDEIRKSYFGQEAQCYSWHTVWNKLYRKTLWDICAEEFKSVQDHIIMTEDIYFSSILFFNVRKLARVENDAYFYCINENASTNSNGIKLSRFKKNIEDITYVFNKAESYLKQNGLAQELQDSFKNTRLHYVRMWSHLAKSSFKGEEFTEASKVLDRLGKEEQPRDMNDYFFETVRTPWNGGLEYIKEQIALGEQKYVFFDIFDTLISRPFYSPSDIFLFLNREYSRATKRNIDFSKFRTEGEQLAREYYGNKYGYADITLEEIYSYIEMHYQMDYQEIQKMLAKERELEVSFAGIRKAGKELFDLALESGKKVYLVTDMYLERETIEKILTKNKISGYKKLYISCEERKLKYDGSLFEKVLQDIQAAPEECIHIGDTWRADIEGSGKAGIQAVFFPKAIDIFENKIAGCVTNHCSDIGRGAGGDMLDYEKVIKNPGFRCMQAIVARRYFDNPYRTFNLQSDFNIDPYLIGYYLVGMHMMGTAKWISQEIKKQGRDRVVFLARDGYLPMKVFQIYAEHMCPEVQTEYMQASRKALMPVMIRDKVNFYQLPVEYRGHTPRTLLEVLGFATEAGEDAEQKELDMDQPFQTLADFRKFIGSFLKELYSEEKHKKAKEMVREYYSALRKGDILFDMGYSGRIQSAICEAAGFPIDALFIHEDYGNSIQKRYEDGFEIHSFYDFRPSVSGLMREHILSDVQGSCIGFARKNGQAEPVFEEPLHEYPDLHVLKSIHEGACDFAEEFFKVFDGYIEAVDYSAQEVSLPFEGFLVHQSRADMHIFSESYFEDLVYGAAKKINIEQFALNYLESRGYIPPVCTEPEPVEPDYTDLPLIDIINQSSKWKRAAIWITLDKKRFINKLKINIRELLKRVG